MYPLAQHRASYLAGMQGQGSQKTGDTRCGCSGTGCRVIEGRPAPDPLYPTHSFASTVSPSIPNADIPCIPASPHSLYPPTYSLLDGTPIDRFKIKYLQTNRLTRVLLREEHGHSSCTGFVTDQSTLLESVIDVYVSSSRMTENSVEHVLSWLVVSSCRTYEKQNARVLGW